MRVTSPLFGGLRPGAGGDAVPSGLRQDLFRADHSRHVGELCRAGGGHEHAIEAGVHATSQTETRARGDAHGDAVVVLVAQQSLHSAIDGLEGDFEIAYVDVLALPSQFGVSEAERGGEGGGIADVEAGHAAGGLEGFKLRIAGAPHVATHGKEGEVDADPVFVGAGLAEVADGGHDEIRVDLAEVFIAEAGGGQDVRGEVLDEDIGALDELLDDLLALFGLEVERYGALVGVEEEEEAALLKARLIVVEGADAARGVSPARPLDLDDICAVITQDSRGVWPRGVVRQSMTRTPSSGMNIVLRPPSVVRSRARGYFYAHRPDRCHIVALRGGGVKSCLLWHELDDAKAKAKEDVGNERLPMPGCGL